MTVSKLRTQLDQVSPGYYLAPAVYQRDLPYLAKVSLTLDSEYTYASNRHNDKYTQYTFTQPGRRLQILTDSYRKVKNNLPNALSWREDLHSPFGLVNWTEITATAELTYPPDKLLLQDSGGFQIAVGSEDFLSPAELLAAHSTPTLTGKAYLGVSLDTPLGAFWSDAITPKLLKQMAGLTRNTNEYFESNGYYDYLNVNHGMTISQRLDWLAASRSRKDRAAGLCIGGFRTSVSSYTSPNAFASAVTRIALESGYKYIHVLGATAGWQMAVLAAIAARHRLVITSDSSSWIQQARTGSLYDLNLQSIDIPKASSKAARYAPMCTCKACTLAGSLHALTAHQMLAMAHNLHTMDAVADSLNAKFTANPSLSVSSFTHLSRRANLKDVDAYIDGARSVREDALLTAQLGPSAFNRSLYQASKLPSNVAHTRLLKILKDYQQWYADHL